LFFSLFCTSSPPLASVHQSVWFSPLFFQWLGCKNV
jgi:hypothetical protein